MLPIYYYNYKLNNLETGLTKLASTVQNLSIEESKKYFDEFNLKYTASLNVEDIKGNIVYSPLNTKSLYMGEDTDIPKDSLPLPNKVVVRDITSNQVSSIISKQIKFSEDNESYTVNVIISLQPIDEASNVLLNLVPLIGIVVIIISVVGSFIYSKKITKPLVEINNNAIQLAALDFEKSCEVNSEDEIGEIALSLNKLASNLQHTMGKLKNTNLKLLDDIEKEREIERKRREFTATISHELKTPITIIKGQLEGMLGNIGIYKDRDKYMNRSLVVLDDMESMVREILEISKLETRGFKPQYTEINLSYLVNNCLEKLSYLISQKDISLNSKIAEELYIQGDEKLIKKAIANIINNSITHTERNEKVLINLYEDNYLIVLTVENEGVHIDEAEFENIFDPFYRIEKSRSRSTGGTGLGLYIVKKILEAHALEYKFTNTQSGVCFKIIFNRSN